MSDNENPKIDEYSEKTAPAIEGDQTMAQKVLLGEISNFVLDDDIECYIEQVEYYFTLNSIKDEVQKVLLSQNMIGHEASKKISKSFKPMKMNEVTYINYVSKLKELFGTVKKPIVERHKFRQRKQKEGESLVDFAVELQTLSEHCEFDTSQLDSMLRDQFIGGVTNAKITRVLLDVPLTTTFKAVVEKAKLVESTRAEAVKMTKGADSVNYAGKSKISRRSATPHRGKSEASNEQGCDIRARREKSSSPENSMTCYRCQGVGHYSYECATKRTKTINRGGQRRSKGVHKAEELGKGLNDLKLNDDDETDNEIISNLLGSSVNTIKSALVELRVEGVPLTMECDTGSCVSVCSAVHYRNKFGHKRILSCDKRLSVVSGEPLTVLGKIQVAVRVNQKVLSLGLVIIDSKREFLPLLGRDWISVIWPEWHKNFTINALVSAKEERKSWRDKTVREFKLRYAAVFDGDLTSPIKDVVVDIRMKENVKPFVHAAYNVPFSYREKVESHLDELEKVGIIERVEYAEWASPLVTVLKPNKKDLRICMDGSVTINPYIETHHYPLPLIDDLISNKSEARVFALIDLKGAYQQLLVGKETKKLLVVNTIKGLFAYNRLPFGVKPAASIFQSVMDRILKGLVNVQAYIDDVLIWAKNDDELKERLLLVLDRLLEYNVKVNTEKCCWFVEKVRYLGHEISEAGIAPNPDKVKAIVDAPIPENTTQLKAFLGMVLFYGKFVKLDTLLSPLYNLLKHEVFWEWDNECQKAFEGCKREICSDRILMHYDPKKPIRVTCDASDDGMCGIMSHIEKGVERPVFFVSRTFTSAEKKYPILHREALAIVFAMEKFYKYVLGHHVEIFTDHKPLEGIFSSKKGEPALVVNRLQRYVMRMSIFDYVVKHKPGKDIGHADCLSRLPIKESPSKVDQEESQIGSLQLLTSQGPKNLNVENIAKETDRDAILSRVRDKVVKGWRKADENGDLKGYYLKRELLGVQSDCLTFRERTVIPEVLKAKVMKLLHANHAGMVKMKQIAREYVFWIGIDKEIELFVKSCEACQVLRKDKPNKEYGQWAETSYPFERVHIDFFHYLGKTFLILVDVFTRWLEIRQMSRTTTTDVGKELDSIFSVFGFPTKMVSDNGPPFNSYEFLKFAEERNITLIKSPPYHPQSNGIAERAVQTTKAVLKKLVLENNNKSFQILKLVETFLSNYRNMPSTEDKIVPAHMMFTFKPKTALSRIKVGKKVRFNINEDNEIAQLKSEDSHKRVIPSLNFKKNEKVLYLSRGSSGCFSYPAIVLKKLSDFTYQIKVKNVIKMAHINQLRKTVIKSYIFGKSFNDRESEATTVEIDTNTNESSTRSSESSESSKYETPEKQEAIEISDSQEEDSDVNNDDLTLEQRELRRSKRNKRNVLFDNFKGPYFF